MIDQPNGPIYNITKAPHSSNSENYVIIGSIPRYTNLDWRYFLLFEDISGFLGEEIYVTAIVLFIVWLSFWRRCLFYLIKEER